LQGVQQGENIMPSAQLTGIVSSVILFFGVFTPIVRFPFIGTINYIHNGRPEGIIVLSLAAISFFFAYGEKLKWLAFTGAASLATLSFTFWKFQSVISGLAKDMEKDMAGNPFKELEI
jgi:hypothetical protein